VPFYSLNTDLLLRAFYMYFKATFTEQEPHSPNRSHIHRTGVTCLTFDQYSITLFLSLLLRPCNVDMYIPHYHLYHDIRSIERV